jgi:predicted metalloprotease
MCCTALALIATACGADAGVISLSAIPTPTVVTIPPISTVPQQTTGGEVATGAAETAQVEDLPTVSLPPIVEPELRVSIPFTDVVDADANKPARSHDDFVAVAFADIERWWGEVFPVVYGQEHEPLDGGVFAGYPERRTAIPGCGARTTDYLDLQLYVAFYCEFGDFMAYDDGDGADSLLTPLAEAYGPAVMGIVLAHEYGHTIQSRIGALDEFLPTIVTEQQADCFAGAWTGQAFRGESPLLRLGDADVRAGLLAMLEVRDPVGTDQFVPGGHGSAFDRVGAFQEGFIAGPQRCSELLDTPLPLMPNQFQGIDDLRREGNASYDCSDEASEACRPAPEFLAEDINDFWMTALGASFTIVRHEAIDEGFNTVACRDRVDLAAELAVCGPDRAVVFDEPAVRELYDEFGDFSLGYFYGIGWAELVQQHLGSQLVGEPRALLNDCFTGAWVRDITPDQLGRTGRSTTSVSASPGDLDEAIRIAILVGDEGVHVDNVGSPFEKISSFRTGVLGGLEACQALLDS